MGFDLTAKNERLGEKGYFRASIYQMILLRTSMLAGGVDDNLVYGKFAGNDGLFVTALQSRKIAGSLTAWLKRRSLTVQLSERNNLANASNEAYFDAIRNLGRSEDRRTLQQFLNAKSVPFKLDSGARKVVRDFAEFSSRSGGFWVA
jgi:hypothetical protein